VLRLVAAFGNFGNQRSISKDSKSGDKSPRSKILESLAYEELDVPTCDDTVLNVLAAFVPTA
jgi:hypothetical protein